ncbi:hydroxymethylbilane synthase [Candidatus Symbiobacter mobilis]|uniref:Porphobilinogen deaminase n=1 Tax=Candidatus Symbiobacter mobilis CR TaxID=946483 RepID=U5NCG1_9BURK|nr:hydroxymethylbilane synthase [Candidatus Symbiobacter mobilis]AGX87834.1 hydroxymethylbilane synthase [Candidatus Symbiobacter mobilis CR]
MSHFIIATRQSRLALWQAQHVQSLLERLGHEVRVLGMLTQGDRMLGAAPLPAGGKNLFVKELETALVDGRADLAVHSLKDMPAILPEGLMLACVPARDDPRDAWISPRFGSINELPAGATVGTASLRRAVWIRALRPDLRVAPLRGNLDSRLRKLDDGAFDGIVLSACGLQRLGLQERIRAVFETDILLPSPGQGALGIEVDAQRKDVLDALAPLVCHRTWLAVEAERAVSRTLGSGCSTPVAAHATIDDGTLTLEAGWGDPGGRLGVLRVRRTAKLNNLHDARQLGEATARALRSDVRRAGAELGDA